jgi:DNA-binding XRE family transcriptional regulator
MRFKRRNEYGITTLELNGTEMDLQIKLVSKLGKKERRAVARSFLQQIRPWIKCFTRSEIYHSVNRRQDLASSETSALSPFEAKPLQARSGAIGFQIRMKRLKLGQSQSLLAEQLGIRRSHLSDIERGLHLPHPRTRLKIEQLLEIQLTQGDEAGGDSSPELSDVGFKPDTIALLPD